MADDSEDGRIRYDALGIGDAGVRVALIIEGCQFDFESHFPERTGKLVYGQLGAVLDGGAEYGH